MLEAKRVVVVGDIVGGSRLLAKAKDSITIKGNVDGQSWLAIDCDGDVRMVVSQVV
jgi:hypothetical protein